MRLRIGGALAVLALAGCGGGSGAPETPSPSDSPSPSATASPAASSGALQSEPYLEVPDGVTLAPPGTERRLKEAAVAAWMPRQDLVGVLEVDVRRLERTTVARSLTDYSLDVGARDVVPYFVHLLVRNRGATDLGNRQVPLYAVTDAQELVGPTGIEQDFAECPGSLLPAVFAPGDLARSCLIFLMPAGRSLSAVMFRPPEGIVPITWTGPVTNLAQKDRGGRRAEIPADEPTAEAPDDPGSSPEVSPRP
ncbi:hypothetical protein [Nocardioides sp. R-C-SC26]|uniref:hypothetical protein n=1 Tax=Nocardioides sp. R-C-SC26 TaxID=2870414 RepID=UPI001E45ADA9|nr:hypothetical protein [Nocardioides sp. R-C-SC26]